MCLCECVSRFHSNMHFRINLPTWYILHKVNMHFTDLFPRWRLYIKRNRNTATYGTLISNLHLHLQFAYYRQKQIGTPRQFAYYVVYLSLTLCAISNMQLNHPISPSNFHSPQQSLYTRSPPLPRQSCQTSVYVIILIVLLTER